MHAYTLQERERDLVGANTDLRLPVDSTEYIISAQIFQDLNVSDIILMTNNPLKYDEQSRHNLNIASRMAEQVLASLENDATRKTEMESIGHRLDDPSVPGERSTQSTYLN